jgi:two-component system, NarL family, nitrate/nitrite response regulator NarL
VTATGEPGPRALVVAGHPVIGTVLRHACATGAGADVLAEVADGASAIDAVVDLSPDLLILDLELPDADGLTILHELREGGFAGRVVVLSDRDDGATVLHALRLGADAFLTKHEGMQRAGSAIKTVVDGGRDVSPDLDQAAVEELGRYARRERQRSSAALTPREHDVLLLLAEGMTWQQIGRRLGISPRTVESHVAKIYRRLHVSSRVQAVGKAASLGLIDLT